MSSGARIKGGDAEITLSPRAHPRYAEIESAIRRLAILPEESFRVSHLAELLCIYGTCRDHGPPPYLQPAPPDTVAKELTDLAKRAISLADKIDNGGRTTRAREQLAQHIRNLHAPTIAALWDAPAYVFDGECRLADIRYLASGLPEKLNREGAVTSRELRIWAQIAESALETFLAPRKADLDSDFLRMFPDAARLEVAPPKTKPFGRPPDRIAHNVASTLARHYALLTGKQPTLPTRIDSDKGRDGEIYGEYLDFVREIFQLLNIELEGLSSASRAAYRLRGKGRKK